MAEVPDEVRESLRLIEDLKFFLATAPANWQENQVIRRYYLNNDEGFISCVFWNNLYFITGTDIVRCIFYKFQHFGRTITDRKKFEEGIFSDLRNLKSGTDAVLEHPKSEFLEFLFKNSCLRTQKKQKVFFWFNVPHDKLMADALERDIKKERTGQTPTSVAKREPALSFVYEDTKTKNLYAQLCDHLGQERFQETRADVSSDNEPSVLSNAMSSAGARHDNVTSSDPSDHETQGKSTQVYGSKDVEVDEEEDDDDTFPLDYLDKQFNSREYGEAGDPSGREYITLDQNYHSGAFVNSLDTDFHNLDTNMLQNSTSLVSNEDYLIEQTIPLRGPMSSSQMYFPRSAKFPEEHPVYPHPMASAAGMQYPPSAMMAPFPPHYEPGYYLHDPYHMSANGYEDFHPAQVTPIGIHPMYHMEAGVPPYVHYEDPDMPLRNSKPSQRQQEISANMMRKRQQMQYGRPSRVTKPKLPTKLADYDSRYHNTIHVKQEEDGLRPSDVGQGPTAKRDPGKGVGNKH